MVSEGYWSSRECWARPLQCFPSFAFVCLKGHSSANAAVPHFQLFPSMRAKRHSNKSHCPVVQPLVLIRVSMHIRVIVKHVFGI